MHHAELWRTLFDRICFNPEISLVRCRWGICGRESGEKKAQRYEQRNFHGRGRRSDAFVTCKNTLTTRESQPRSVFGRVFNRQDAMAPILVICAAINKTLGVLGDMAVKSGLCHESGTFPYLAHVSLPVTRHHMTHPELILVLDYGSQYSQLIARRVRELGVYSELHPFHLSVEKIRQMKPAGIILSGWTLQRLRT